MALTPLSFPLYRRRIRGDAFLLIGVFLFEIKYLIDHFVATLVYRHEWSLLNYLIPTDALSVLYVPPTERSFLMVMTLLAVPFIWIGINLTVRRLEDAGLPLVLAILFFVPVVNLILFTVLAFYPSQPQPVVAVKVSPPPTITAAELTYATDEASAKSRMLSKLLPRQNMASVFVVSAIQLPFSLAAIFLSVQVLRNYGWGIFVGLPFAVGVATSVLHGYRVPRSFGQCMGASLISILMIAATLIGFAWEGAICILMAAPLAVPLVALGAALGYTIQRRAMSARPIPNPLFALLLTVPMFISAEPAMLPKPQLFRVTTSIDVDAPPEVVWNNVVAFAPLLPPREMMFRLGVAYPIGATISGRGPGAIRHCVFSTGSFVEPITVWDESRLLRFSVTENPSPLEEWTPYRSIDPPHLHGFMVARQGQFLLIPLKGNRTRIEGTTWYQHGLFPSSYWRTWSDPIIHAIHWRVLEHIKTIAENENTGGTPVLH